MAKYKNPVLKKGGHKVTSPFGMRTIWGKKQMHNGIDLVGEGASLDYIIAFAYTYQKCFPKLDNYFLNIFPK